jgi:hypothetical protein
MKVSRWGVKVWNGSIFMGCHSIREKMNLKKYHGLVTNIMPMVTMEGGGKGNTLTMYWIGR